MQYRRFGNTELQVSELGFGCARVGGVFAGTSRRETLRLLDRALDAGINFYDTADMYTQGESERLVGEAFGARRGRVVIATKFGYALPTQKRLVSRVKPLIKPLVARLGLQRRQVHAGVRGSVSQQDFSPAYIQQAVEASLQRLRTDYIDIYQLHAPPLEVLERGDFVEPLERLRQQGKVRYWGVACEHYTDAVACMRYAEVRSLQVGLNVVHREALDEVIPRAAREGVGVIARQVFASGLLTRPIEDIAPGQLDSDPAVDARRRVQLAEFGEAAARTGRTRIDLALEFALTQPGVSVVLVGLSRNDQLDVNLAAYQALRDQGVSSPG